MCPRTKPKRITPVTAMTILRPIVELQKLRLAVMRPPRRPASARSGRRASLVYVPGFYRVRLSWGRLRGGEPADQRGGRRALLLRWGGAPSGPGGGPPPVAAGALPGGGVAPAAPQRRGEERGIPGDALGAEGRGRHAVKVRAD